MRQPVRRLIELVLCVSGLTLCQCAQTSMVSQIDPEWKPER